MSHKKSVLSSSQILSLIEEKFNVAWIAFPSDGGEWIASKAVDYFIGFNSSQDSLRSRFIDSINPDDLSDFMSDLSLFSKDDAPSPRNIRLKIEGRTEIVLQIKFCQLIDPSFKKINLIVFKDVFEELNNIQKISRYENNLKKIMNTWHMNALWWADNEFNMYDYIGKDELVFDRDLRGRRYFDLLPPEDHNAVMLELKKGRQGNKPFCFPVRIRGIDGVTRFYQLRAAPLNENGQVMGWAGYISPTPLTAMAEASIPSDDKLLSRLNAAALRAGCAALGWSYKELANRAMLSTSTVNRILTTRGVLIEAFRASSLTALVESMEAAGITYRLDDADGFHLHIRGEVSA